MDRASQSLPRAKTRGCKIGRGVVPIRVVLPGALAMMREYDQVLLLTPCKCYINVKCKKHTN
jgi:hypothetical protein